MIRVLVVDDEPMARAKLRRLLAEAPDVAVVGEAATAAAAVAAVRDHAPDVVFLDVDMPDGSGLDAMASFDEVPLVVFATAYAEFAVRAFELNALDYLLKPFDGSRLGGTLERVRDRLRAADRLAPGDLADVADELRRVRAELARGAGASGADRLLVPEGDGMRFVKVADIAWIGSADNYVEVHAEGRAYLLRDTLAAVEQQLDPGNFARIHRRTIVSLDHVRVLRTQASGQLVVELLDGTTHPVGRLYREKLTQRWRG